MPIRIITLVRLMILIRFMIVLGFIRKLFSLLWDEENVGRRLRLGIMSLVVCFVYWSYWFGGPWKPPSPPTGSCEMRPHPSQTLEASGAEVVPETSHEPSLQIAYLIAPDESELSDIDLAAADLAPSTNATATQREGPSTSETDPHSDNGCLCGLSERRLAFIRVGACRYKTRFFNRNKKMGPFNRKGPRNLLLLKR